MVLHLSQCEDRLYAPKVAPDPLFGGHVTRSIFDRYNIVSEQDLTDAVRKLQKFQDAAEPACQPAQASTPSDHPEFVN